MKYPVDTSTQLSAVLRALRKSKHMSQTDLGRLLGVNQKRIAKIESDPGVTSFDQITRFVAALGGRIQITETPGKSAKSSPCSPKELNGDDW